MANRGINGSMGALTVPPPERFLSRKPMALAGMALSVLAAPRGPSAPYGSAAPWDQLPLKSYGKSPFFIGKSTN